MDWIVGYATVAVIVFLWAKVEKADDMWTWGEIVFAALFWPVVLIGYFTAWIEQ